MVAIVYTTTNNVQDARKIAHILVEEQLVACVNVIPNIESVYRWKGNIEEENEFLILAKTVDKNVEKTIDRIKQFHSYELPDIIVLPIIGGLKDYLDYLDSNTS